MKGFAPVAVEVPRGRVLMVGSADKVDQTRDGVLLVTDIKTGSARTFTVLNDDPVAPAPSFNCRSTRTRPGSFSADRRWRRSTGSSGRTVAPGSRWP